MGTGSKPSTPTISIAGVARDRCLRAVFMASDRVRGGVQWPTGLQPDPKDSLLPSSSRMQLRLYLQERLEEGPSLKKAIYILAPFPNPGFQKAFPAGVLTNHPPLARITIRLL